MEEVQPGFPDGTAGQVLHHLLDTALHQGFVVMPQAPGLDPSMLARWLYRQALSRLPGWKPLLQVQLRHLLPDGPLPGQPDWPLEGAWICLESSQAGDDPTGLVARLKHAAQSHRCHLLLLMDSSGNPLPPRPALVEEPPRLLLAPEWLQALKRHDAFHSVAVDPALTWLRRSLLSHCRSASPIHLTGEPGTDKAVLPLWAHALLDDRPLSRIFGNQGRARPGEWALFEEVSELGEEQRHGLEERLRSFDEPPSMPPPSPRGHRPRAPRLEGIIGDSAALSAVLERVLLLAPRNLPVLIQGEPGVGKEAIARALHELSGRTGAFVALDMGAIQETLAESELFGHRKGAFTGADHHRPGAFRTAHGGTLFLDEIGNASPSLQTRLLRALQEGLVQPLGEDSPVQVNVRVVSATNGDLDAMVRQGRFRADLLARLSVGVLSLPPLRERLEDLDALAVHFLSQAISARGNGRSAVGGTVPFPWCTPEARHILEHYAWPGNIRELSNILHFAAAMAPAGAPLEAQHLGPLSPHLRRRVPVMSTSTQISGDPNWGLERHLVQTMTAVTLTVPPLRDRDLASRTHAVLSVMEGRPIHPAALRVLASAPWWGNHRELASRLSVLRSLPAGPVDLESLHQHLPEIMSPGGSAPIRVLLSPSAGQGVVEGFTREFQVSSLLLGRIRRMEELQALLRAGDARGQAWMEQIRHICGATDPTCLELGHLSRLSRVQALITRGPQGLMAHAMPGTSLPVLAGTLEATSGASFSPSGALAGGGTEALRGGELVPLKPGAPVVLGRGGELRIPGQGPMPYLQVFFFLGAIAFEDLARVALERVRSSTELAPATQENAAVVVQLKAEVDVPGLHVWPLTLQEADALTELMASYRSGQLKVHVARHLETYQSPALTRLKDYLERAPRLSQYLVRLYEFPANRIVRDKLKERLKGEPDRETRLALLPEGIRRSIEELT